MVRVESFQDVHDILQKYIPGHRPQAYTLDRVRALMEYLDNPQDAYKIIHVAGTSGKTSTCYYLAAMLKASGQKVGLSVSPHVDEVNERVQINLLPLPEAEFCRHFSVFLSLVEKSEITPTYFELLSAFAFWEFSRQQIDYVVIEVGMGGLLDGTNVINRDDKICVITDIGLDHTEVLGNNLELIAAQKAGIIHKNNHVFMYEQSRDVMNVLNEVSRRQGANLHIIFKPQLNKASKGLPLFQQRNWNLANEVIKYAAKRDRLGAINNKTAAAAVKTYIPARMEVVEYKGKMVIMDGAHNAQKLEALVESISAAYPNQPLAAMVGFIQTKRPGLRNNLKALLPITDHLITVSFETPGAPYGSIGSQDLADICRELGFESYDVDDDPVLGFQRLLNRPEPVVLVTGSFFLLNHIRPLLKYKKT